VKKRASIFLRIALLILGLSAACGGISPQEERFEGEAMGTTYVVRLGETLSESERIGVARAIAESLEDVNARMSGYRFDSELSRFNRAGAGAPFPVSGELFEVVSEAVRVSESTSGAFDITVAPLLRLWGFGPDAVVPREPPGEAEIEAARSRVGFRNLALDDDAVALTKRIDGLECDLSGIALGYGVDRVAEALERRGHRDYMVEVGGEVRTLGKDAAGDPWRIPIEAPSPGSSAVQRVVPMSGFSMAASRAYRSSYELDGKLHSHLIDPRTGRPVEHGLASVIVIGGDCTSADALATGLLVLGPEDGYRLALEQDVAALFLLRSPEGRVEERATPAFAELFN
jgi:thiamine biosynthesis lipoprotein